MRPLSVVVTDVRVKDRAELLFADNEQPIQRLVADGLDRSFAVGVGARSAVGREDHTSAFGAQYVVELVDEFGIAIMDGEFDTNVEPAELPAQVSGLLGDPGRVGMSRAVSVEDAAAVDLNEDHHVKRLEQDGVDGKEVTGQDRPRVSAQELRPGWTLTARSWRDVMSAQDTADGCGRDPVAELQQLALDAAIAPAWVLPAQANDQLPQLV